MIAFMGITKKCFKFNLQWCVSQSSFLVYTYFKPLRHIDFEQTIEKSKQIMLQAGKCFGMRRRKEPSYHSENPKGKSAADS